MLGNSHQPSGIARELGVEDASRAQSDREQVEADAGVAADLGVDVDVAAAADDLARSRPRPRPSAARTQRPVEPAEPAAAGGRREQQAAPMSVTDPPRGRASQPATVVASICPPVSAGAHRQRDGLDVERSDLAVDRGHLQAEPSPERQPAAGAQPQVAAGVDHRRHPRRCRAGTSRRRPRRSPRAARRLRCARARSRPARRRSR